MSTATPLIPIYTTGGDVGALLVYPYLYNIDGEWIGWVTADRIVYSVHGHYAGRLSEEWRILRRRSLELTQPRRIPPPPPGRFRPPALLPLAPQMPEVPQGQVDVLQEEPDLLPPLDLGELREDLD
ncbi:MAG TPA: hypothetical protein VF498_04925 [Anaerolineales bacterium]